MNELEFPTSENESKSNCFIKYGMPLYISCIYFEGPGNKILSKNRDYDPFTETLV